MAPVVARLTPDQKVACSNHVVIKLYLCKKKRNACTGHMGTKRKTLCFLFSSAFMPDCFKYSPNLSSLSCKNTGGLRGAMVAPSDSRSEGCVFESRRGQITFLLKYIFKACTGQMDITRKTL